MAQRRARSAERGGDRLVDALERLAAGPRQVALAQPFKAPQFEGKGDVEYFITRFEEVSVTNGWEPAAALLHIREALKEGAQDCGRGATVAAVFTALRARYGLSPREARSRLSTLRKEFQTTLQEHAVDVDRLISIAYPDLPEEHQANMTMDTFCSTLGNAYLQRHLLAVDTPNLEAAVRAGNEFLQIRTATERGKANPAVRQVGDEEDEMESSPTMATVLNTIMQTMKQMAEQMEKLKVERSSGNSNWRKEPTPKRLTCWGCGKEGHLRRDCAIKTWPVANSGVTQPGNAQSPQQ